MMLVTIECNSCWCNFITEVDNNLLIEGETDWKVLVLDVNDPMANQINGTYLPLVQKISSGITYMSCLSPWVRSQFPIFIIMISIWLI